MSVFNVAFYAFALGIVLLISMWTLRCKTLVLLNRFYISCKVFSIMLEFKSLPFIYYRVALLNPIHYNFFKNLLTIKSESKSCDTETSSSRAAEGLSFYLSLFHLRKLLVKNHLSISTSYMALFSSIRIWYFLK